MDTHLRVPLAPDEYVAIERMAEWENGIRAFGPAITPGEWVRRLVVDRLGLTKYTTVTASGTTPIQTLGARIVVEPTEPYRPPKG